jgi:hypothetical protein
MFCGQFSPIPDGTGIGDFHLHFELTRHKLSNPEVLFAAPG